MNDMINLSQDQNLTAKQRVEGLIVKARNAMDDFVLDQKRIDDAVTAIAWSIFEPSRARELAELAVRDTGLGDVDSKIIKNTRKTFGTLRDLLRVKTVGIIEENVSKGITKYAKPVGVVAAISPSTISGEPSHELALLSICCATDTSISPFSANCNTRGGLSSSACPVRNTSSVSPKPNGRVLGSSCITSLKYGNSSTSFSLL